MTATLSRQSKTNTTKHTHMITTTPRELRSALLSPDNSMLKMQIKITHGIREQTASSKVDKTRFNSVITLVKTGKRPFMVSMAIPVITARKIVCKVLPSKKDLKILEGMISKAIAAIWLQTPSLVLAALTLWMGKNITPANTAITPDKADSPKNQLKSILKMRFIWAILSMLNILAITETKRKGMTMAFRNPKKALLKGVNTEAGRIVCIEGAKRFTVRPQIMAAPRAKAMATTGFSPFFSG